MGLAQVSALFLLQAHQGTVSCQSHHLCLEYFKRGHHGCLFEVSVDSRVVPMLFLCPQKYLNKLDRMSTM